MGILNIEVASRKGAHILVQLYGGASSGKTLSALKLARGMVGPNGKIGVLDTEAGRARLYADKVSGGFMVGELSPPFTPERYKIGIEEFIKAGVDVLVIDSFSHIWEGPGGVLEQADSNERAGKFGLLKWQKPKRDYKSTVTFLLTTKLNIIFCSRGKQQIVEEMVDGKKTYKTLPWEPIQDKRLKFEMTIVLPMTTDGNYETEPGRLKCPGDLASLFTGKPVTEATGAALADWIGGRQTIDHDLELLRKRAADIADEGAEAFRSFWAELSKDQRAQLKPALDNYQSAAKAADDEREEANRKDGDASSTDAGSGPKGVDQWKAWRDEIGNMLNRAKTIEDLRTAKAEKAEHMTAFRIEMPDLASMLDDLETYAEQAIGEKKE